MTDRKSNLVSNTLSPVALTRSSAVGHRPGWIFVSDDSKDSHACVEPKELKGVVDTQSERTSTLLATLPTPSPSPPSLRTSPMKALAMKQVDLVIGASYQLAFRAATPSIIDALVPNQLLLTVPDFVLMNGVYEEFFVNSMRVDYQPANRYSGAQPAVSPTAFIVTPPLSVVSLHHDAQVYGTHADSVNNMHFKPTNAADPWTYTWKNVEKKSSTVAVSPPAGEYSTQSWARNTSLLTYTGAVQIISPTAFAGQGDVLVGTTAVRWVVSFRARR